MNADLQRFRDFVRGEHACIFIPTCEEDYALSLVRQAALDAAQELRVWSIIDGVRDGLVQGQPPYPDTENAAAALYFVRRDMRHGCYVFLDLVTHLRDDRTLRMAREAIARARAVRGVVVLIDHRDELPTALLAETTRFEISLPDEAEIEVLIKETLRLENLTRPPELALKIDIKRSAFTAMIRNLCGLQRTQVRRIAREMIALDDRFDDQDLNTAMVRKRQALQGDGLLEFVEAPVEMSEIGGIRRLKRWLEIRRDALGPQAREFGLAPPRGVLLLGVQGAGKSFCAKAIATAWRRPLMRMDVGALYDRYIGESERRLRDALHQAERMSPLILWVDEIEKCFASAASHNTDGGLSQRMFATLLTWMQEHRSGVFIVATANDIEALPPELLRKGRFDEIFFVDLPTQEVRRDILAIHLRRRRRDPAKFDLDRLAAASEGFSGAELEQAVVGALHEAFSRKQDLDSESILRALAGSPPLSVTMAEDVAQLRAWAHGRCVPAD